MVSNYDVIYNYFNAYDRDHYNHNRTVFFEGDILYSYGRHFPLAIKIKNGYLLNGDRYSNSTAKHQNITRAECNNNSVEIPVSAIVNGANIPITEFKNIKILDKQEAYYETKTVKDKDGKEKEIQIHHLGASLIKYKNRFLLSGIDESGKSWNTYFLIELPKPAFNVNDAYRILAGNLSDGEYNKYMSGEIKRQGEYFLKPVDSPLDKTKGLYTKPLKQLAMDNIKEIFKKTPILEKQVYNMAINYSESDEFHKGQHILNKLKEIEYNNNKYLINFYSKENKELPKNFKLVKYINSDKYALYSISNKKGIIKDYNINGNSGNNHKATECLSIGNDLFIRGTLRHNQHKMVSLGKTWHKVIKNTQKGSWTASGNVD